jgi:large repetitive protein
VNPAPDAPDVPVLAVSNPDCAVAVGSIEVTSPVGVEYEYSIDGVTFQTGTLFTGLVAGDYTITVRNTDNCTSSETATVNPAPDAPDVPVLAVSNPDCAVAVGSIEVTSPVGVEYEYSIDGVTFQTGTLFTGLAAGDYTITVRNTDNCIAAKQLL